METLKSLRTDRENLGIELYGIQQQLARQQMLVEQEQDKQTTMSLLRKQKYETLAQVRELYQNMQKQVGEERKQSRSITTVLCIKLTLHACIHVHILMCTTINELVRLIITVSYCPSCITNSPVVGNVLALC